MTTMCIISVITSPPLPLDVWPHLVIGLDRLRISEKFDGYFYLAHLTVGGKNIPFLMVDG